jgi:hypothetical protein
LLIAKLCREFESGFPITNANSRIALVVDCDLATVRAHRARPSSTAALAVCGRGSIASTCGDSG